MARSTTEDSTAPGIRSLGGLICPRCRHHDPDAGTVPVVQRCPNDGYAMIAPERFAEADGDPFLGTTVAGRFVILGKLGAGSMGTVYRARQEAMGRDVAIKILRSDRAFDAHAKARFTREARAMSQLTSPHTVTVFDFGEIPEHNDELGTETASLYLAMELLAGQALGDRLKTVHRLPVAEATKIARHALLSLAEAHDKGIIHRDLKPDNLFLTRGADGQEICKVLDFGIAKVTSEPGSVDALETQAGTVFGTPRYMSPEQAQGKSLDARSDLYSLGVLLYQMLVGRPPFIDDDAVVVMARHIKSTPLAPAVAAPDAGISDALSRVVMRALAKEPDDRPASAQQLIEDLDRALDQRAVPAAAGSSAEMPALVRNSLDEVPAQLTPRSQRRSRTAWIAVGAGAAGVLVGLVALGPLRGAPRPPLAQKSLAAEARRLEADLRAAEAAALPSAQQAPAPPTASAAPPGSADAPVPPTSSSVALPPAGGKKPGSGRKRYKRLD